MLKLKINGTDRIGEVLKGSIQGKESINARSTCSFVLLDLYGTGKPAMGSNVELYDDEDNLVFGGTVDRGTKTRLSSSNILQYEITACDYHQLTEKRLIAETYENQTAGYIVNHIITSYLSEENITAGTIGTGGTFAKVTFSYKKASDCLDELSSLSGYQWRVNKDKTLDFFARNANNASWDVTDSSQITNITIEDNRDDYRNIQYVAGVKGVTNTRTDSFAGDGKTKTFVCSYPLFEQPYLEVDYIPIPSTSIGIKNVDNGKLWYWEKSEKEIVQASGQTPLTESQSLTVNFKGEFETIILQRNEAEIASRQTIEGNSGKYESFEVNKTIETHNAGIEFAEGKLRRYAQLNEIVTYTTEINGLRAGDLQTITRTFFGLNDDYLIEEITFSSIGDGKIEYQVKALSGESVGGWTYFFKSLLLKNEIFTINEGDVLIKSKELASGLIFSDSLTISKATIESRIGYAQVGYGEIQ